MLAKIIALGTYSTARRVAEPNFTIPLLASATCRYAQRQGDEYFCARCGLRWDAAGDPPYECDETFRAGCAAFAALVGAE